MIARRPTIREAFAAHKLIERFLKQRVGEHEYYWSNNFKYSQHMMAVWDSIQGVKAKQEYIRRIKKQKK